MAVTFKTSAGVGGTIRGMPIDMPAATTFMATHARVLDRRRFDLFLGGGEPARVLAALDAYRNPDGGYGWGLEPDLRSTESQPVAAMHAFEVLAEVGPAASDQATALCDWLLTVALDDGGLPFALPVRDPAGCAPWWVEADPARSSLQITAAVAAGGHEFARHDPTLAGHPWLAAANRYCAAAIRTMDTTPHAYELSFAVRFLDAASDALNEAPELLEIVASHVPPGGTLPVEGGVEGEVLRPLDLAPRPTRPARALLAPDVVAKDLDRLAAGQRADGGWPIDWSVSSPAAELEWRGYVTVRAIGLLRANGALDAPTPPRP